MSKRLYETLLLVTNAAQAGPASSTGRVTLNVAEARAKLGMTRAELKSCVRILIVCGYAQLIRSWAGNGWGLRLSPATVVATAWAA